MRRRILLVVAAFALLRPDLPANAEHLGGNYRGPRDEALKLRGDSDPPPDSPPPPPDPPAPPPPPADDPGAGGGDSSDTPPNSDPPPDAGDGTSEESGGSGSYRGPSGEVPLDGRSPADPPPDSPPPPPPPPPPPAGDSGGASTGDDSAPPASTSTGETAGGGDLSGGSSGVSAGRKSPADDGDRVWFFTFEGAREEYLQGHLGRRTPPRMAPPRSSSWFLASAPVPIRHREELDGEKRRKAESLILARTLDPDPSVRDAAILALGKSRMAGSSLQLVRIVTRDPDLDLREDALLALGLTQDGAEALDPLLANLVHASSAQGDRRACYAALGLGLLGDCAGAAPALRALFARTSGRPETVEEAACAATALGMLQDGDSIPLLARTIASPRAPLAARVYALHGLGRMDSVPEARRRELVRHLIAAAGDRRAAIRRAAFLAMGSFPECAGRLLADGLTDSDDYTKNLAATSLGRIAAGMDPDTPLRLLIAGQLEQTAAAETRNRTLSQHGTMALAAMGGVGGGAALVNGLEERLSRCNEVTGAAAILALGLHGHGGDGTDLELRRIFSSRAHGSRVQAYAGLALALRDASGTSTLLATAVRGEERRTPADVARSAVLGLGLTGGIEEVALLVEVLEGKQAADLPETARHFLMGTAAVSLGLIADARAVDLLEPLLQSDEWRTRAFAVVALGYLLEPDPALRVAPRIGTIFRHADFTTPLPVVTDVRAAL